MGNLSKVRMNLQHQNVMFEHNTNNTQIQILLYTINFRIASGKLRKKPGKKIASSLILSQKTLEKYRKDAAKSRKGYLLMKGMLIESKKKLLRWL